MWFLLLTNKETKITAIARNNTKGLLEHLNDASIESPHYLTKNYKAN